jgi:hypothetical protein
VYGISYQDYLHLPIDVFMQLYSSWQLSAGLKSGTEVFQVASKSWNRIQASNYDFEPPKTPDAFLAAVKAAKERTGKDKVGLKEVFVSMEK